jgi:hypothetical protein
MSSNAAIATVICTFLGVIAVACWATHSAVPLAIVLLWWLVL